MIQLTKIIGQRVRHYRLEKGWSQEQLAERAGCHPTYIGQIERGEKNATVESLWKISSGLGVSLSKLFECIGDDTPSRNIPLACYEIVASRSSAEQEALMRLLNAVEGYKNT